jgi:hypothetical protein
MPPRKKTKRAHSPTPQDDTTALSSAGTPGSSDSVGKPDTEYDLISDPWTDEQETALLKAIIKWKPVGECNWRIYCVDSAANRFGPRPTQTLSDAGNLRLPKEPGVCALYGGTYADSRDLEETWYIVQSGSA